jgi:hypothetical protein
MSPTGVATGKQLAYSRPMFAPTFIQHRGVRILRLDFVGLSEPELLAAFDQVRGIVHAAPPRSLRILTGHRSLLTPGAAVALKRLALSNRPYVRACAVIGTSCWKVIITDVQAHGREDVMFFDDEASAIEWLTSTK